MRISITLKDIPDAVATELRRRAAAHRCTIDEEAVEVLKAGLTEKPRLTPAEFVAKVRARGLHSSAEAAGWIREDRDARSRG